MPGPTLDEACVQHSVSVCRLIEIVKQTIYIMIDTNVRNACTMCYTQNKWCAMLVLCVMLETHCVQCLYYVLCLKPIMYNACIMFDCGSNVCVKSHSGPRLLY